MNVLMMTNTYLPHVGGVANSVATFTRELRDRGHRVMVVAPQYDDPKADEPDVVRLPAIQHFSGSDFAVIVPVPTLLQHRLQGFQPRIVHAHHPYLVGSTAVRIAKKLDLPLVYTQHTMFEEYTHYVPIGHERLKHFVIRLCTGYANMCDMAIAPSESIAAILRERGVTVPVEVIPTGINPKPFEDGDGGKVRQRYRIPETAWVLGHVGRLAPEKNPEFLGDAVAGFLNRQSTAHFLIVGYGPSEQRLRDGFQRNHVADRVHFTGKLTGPDLADAYHAMDAFVFSSKSETQGLVLAEAMTCGLPVVALDAPGVREVLQDGVNGYLLPTEDKKDFIAALAKLHALPPERKRRFREAAQATANRFTIDQCVAKLIAVYHQLAVAPSPRPSRDESIWRRTIEQLNTERELLANLKEAVGDAL